MGFITLPKQIRPYVIVMMLIDFAKNMFVVHPWRLFAFSPPPSFAVGNQKYFRVSLRDLLTIKKKRL